MPRTKYSRKTKTSNESLEDMMIKNFDRHVQLRIAKLERDGQLQIKSFETYIDVKISRLPAEIRRMTLGEIFTWESDIQENDEISSSVSSSVKGDMRPPLAIPKARTVRKAATGKRATATSDDGYATEGGTSSVGTISRARSHAQVSSTRRTRSLTRESRTKLIEINQKTVRKQNRSRGRDRTDKSILKVDNFKTPAMPRHMANAYDVVTPKIKPNTPLNVLRRPRQGEMALSMQGSPLLVSAVINEKTANINVPLANGNVMSLLPQEGLRMSNIPPLDPETMHQLETLKKHIEKVIAFK